MTDEPKSFSKKLKSVLDAKGLAIIGLILMQGWGYFSELVTTGAQQKFQNQVEALYGEDGFSDKVDSLFQANMQDPTVLQMVLRSKAVDEFATANAAKVEQTLIDKIMRDDSTRLTTVNYLGRETGLRDEVILPKLAEMLKAWEEGTLMTKRQAEALLTRRINATF